MIDVFLCIRKSLAWGFPLNICLNLRPIRRDMDHVVNLVYYPVNYFKFNKNYKVIDTKSFRFKI